MLQDYKYSGSDEAGPEAARTFLCEHGMLPERAESVAAIIRGVGFKNALVRKGGWGMVGWMDGRAAWR